MRKIVLASAFLIIGFCSFSQEKIKEDKKLRYGFNFGITISNLLYDEILPNSLSVSNDVGFSLGILANYKFNEIISVSPKTEISFNNSNIVYTNAFGDEIEYDFMPVNLNMIVHINFANNKSSFIHPHFFIGPNFRIPLSTKDDTISELPTSPDFAIDFGIGFNKALPHFNLIPELRYSYGLLDVNKSQDIESINFHSVTILFSFI